MVAFSVMYRLFHSMNAISILLSLLLFTVYQRSRQNILVRSACFVAFCVGTILLVNRFRESAHLHPDDSFCKTQAVMLNYFYVSLHAHFCFLMVNNCFSALGWNAFRLDSTTLRMWLFMLVSYMVPTIPTLIITISLLTHNVNPSGPATVVLQPRAFYCSVTSPPWEGYLLWYLIFCVPGITCAFYLLYKTWKTRQKIIQFSRTSQIGSRELFRLIFAISLYISMSLMSISQGSRMAGVVEKLVKIPENSMTPYKQDDYCTTCSSADALCITLCPAFRAFMPAIVGICLFLMYGFGSVAVKAYRKIQVALTPAALRRFSQMPLMSDSTRGSISSTNQPIIDALELTTCVPAMISHPRPSSHSELPVIQERDDDSLSTSFPSLIASNGITNRTLTRFFRRNSAPSQRLSIALQHLSFSDSNIPEYISHDDHPESPSTSTSSSNYSNS